MVTSLMSVSFVYIFKLYAKQDAPIQQKKIKKKTISRSNQNNSNEIFKVQISLKKTYQGISPN